MMTSRHDDVKQYRLADGPCYHAEKEVTQKSSGEELGDDRKILQHRLALSKEIRDENRGAVGDAYRAVA